MGDTNFELDVEGFCFKQMSKLQVFNPPENLMTDATNLITVSNQFGKIFVAAGTEIKMIDIAVIETLTSQEDADPTQVVSSFDHKSLETGKVIKHIALSCDGLTLSAVYFENNSLWIGCVDIRYIGDQNLPSPFFAKGKLTAEPDVYLRELEWNPEDPKLAIICLSNGSVSFITLSDQSVSIVATLPGTKKSSSVNWSPRGKNFAAGHDDGLIVLYDKKMTVKKELPCPDDVKGHKVAKVCWIMSHNFAAVYTNTENEEPPKFVCIVSNKDEPIAYMNMEDVYFGLNEERTLSFYIKTIPQWNLLVTMASNAFEGVVIGKVGEKWMRWVLSDDGRAEMPLTEDGDETFPCGLHINLNSTMVIKEGESTLPPTPIFLMVSTNGVLCPYQVVNKMPGIKHQILTRQTALTKDGVHKPISDDPSGESRPVEASASEVKGSLPKPFSSLTSAGASASATKPAPAADSKSQQTPAFPGASAGFGQQPTPGGFFTAPSTGSLFGKGAPNLFSTPTKTDSPASNVPKPGGLFSATTASDKPPVGIFSSDVKTDSPAKSEGSASLFSASSKPAFDLDGKTAQFSAAGASRPLFGADKLTSSSQASSQPSIFSSNAPSTSFSFVSPREPQTVTQNQPVSQAFPTFSQASTFPKSTIQDSKPLSGAENVMSSSQSNTQATFFSSNTPSSSFSFVSPRQPQAVSQTHSDSLAFSGATKPFAFPKTSVTSETSMSVPQSSVATPPTVPLVKPAPTTQAKLQMKTEEAGTTLTQGQRPTPSGFIPPESRSLQSVEDAGKVIPEPQMNASMKFTGAQETTSREAVAIPKENLGDEESAKIEEMTEQLGTDINAKIKEEINVFAGELKSFKEEMSDSKELFKEIGVGKDARALKSETQSLWQTVVDFKTCHEEHRNEFLQQKNKMLNQFDNLEQARFLQTTMHDKRYNNLLKTRSLDPVAARQRKELRSQLGYLTTLISEANDSLDAEWEQAKMTNARRSKGLKSNGAHSIYIAMESIEKIINNLADKVENITLQAEKDQLIAKPFGDRQSFSSNAKLEDGEIDLTVKINEEKIMPESKVHFSPMKQSHFKSFLSKKQSPPRRKVNYQVSDISLAGRPKAASTPAVGASERKLFKFPSETPVVNGKFSTLKESTFEKPPTKEKAKAPPSVVATPGKSPQQFTSKPVTPFQTSSTSQVQVVKMPEEKPAVKFGQLGQATTGFKDTLMSGGLGNAAKVTEKTLFGSQQSFTASDKQSEAVKVPQPSPISQQTSSHSIPNGKPSDMKPKPEGVKNFEADASSASKTFCITASTGSQSASMAVQKIAASNAIAVCSISQSSSQGSSNTYAQPFQLLTGSSVKPSQASGTSFIKTSTPAMPSFKESPGSQGGGSAAYQMELSKAVPVSKVVFGEAVSNDKVGSFSLPCLQKSTDSQAVLTGEAAVPISASKEVSSGCPASISSSLFAKTTSTGSIVTVATSQVTSAVGSASTPLFGLPKPVFSSLASAATPSAASTLFASKFQPASKTTQPNQSVASEAKSATSVTPDVKALLPQASENTANSEKSSISLPASKPSIASSIVGTQALPSSLFATQSSVDKADVPKATTTAPLFTTTAATTASASSSSSSPSTTSKQSLFTAPAFGIKTTESSTSIFTAKSAASSSLPAFGSQSFLGVGVQPAEISKGPETTNVTPSLSTAPSSAPFSTIFGGQPSLFPALGVKNTESKPSAFGATTGSSAPAFGTESPFTSSAGSVPSKEQRDPPKLFGAQSSASATSSSSFGSSSSTGLFRTAPTTTKPLFGAQTGTSSSGLFTQSTSSGSSIIGQQQSTGLFGSKPANTQATTSSIFGGTSSASNSSGLFGTKPVSTSGGLFQSSSTSESPFGQGNSAFGSQPFSGDAGFGGLGLGGKPNNDPSKNPFGTVPSSTSSSNGPSLFGASSGGSGFGSAPTSSSPTRGTFSKGFGAGFLGAPSFGSTSASTASSGIGSTAIFGGAPSFGSTPAFGGAPTFGSTSPGSFGTPASSGAVFGSNTTMFGQQSGFGSLAQQSGPSFGQLSSQAGNSAFGGVSANQNQPSFGSVSSNQNQPLFGNLNQSSSFGQTGPVFGQSSSPQGSSFSAWR